MENLSIDTRTPIEVALGVDENDCTTAKKLYAFLELNPAHYKRWCDTNILNNEFAERDVDFTPFTINGECGGQATTDYKLTAHFAKKLSVKGNSARAEEAREYFTRIEKKVKEAAIDRATLSPSMKMLYGMLDQMAQTEKASREAKQLAQKAADSVEAVKAAVTPTVDNWREEIVRKVRRVQSATGADFKNLNTEMYKELERRAGCDLNTRLRNKQSRMYESGCTKTQINNLRKLDIIDEDKKLLEIYGKIVTEYVIRYCA